MHFALVVSAAPDPAALPLRFATAVLAAGHALGRVFFLRDGVRHGEPGTEFAAAWQALQARHPALELALCIGAAERRGIPATEEAGRATPLEPTSMQGIVQPGFVHVGLGQLVAALAEAERVVDFPATADTRP
jgi:tRNA 2-thiouridine synthesizing protein D